MRIDKNGLLTFEKITRSIQEKQKTIIDLGCSDGQLLSFLAENGCTDLYGAGYDVKAKNAKSIYSGIDFNALNWSEKIENISFDYVIASDVIEHLLNPFNFLSEINNILKPSGKLILTFPNVHNLRSILAYAFKGRFCGFFGNNWNNNHPIFDQHIWVPNLHLLEYFAKMNQLKIEDISYINGMGKLFSITTMVTLKRFLKS